MHGARHPYAPAASVEEALNGRALAADSADSTKPPGATFRGTPARAATLLALPGGHDPAVFLLSFRAGRHAGPPGRPSAPSRRGFPHARHTGLGEYSLILSLLVGVAIMALLFTCDGLGTLLGDISHSL